MVRCYGLLVNDDWDARNTYLNKHYRGWEYASLVFGAIFPFVVIYIYFVIIDFLSGTSVDDHWRLDSIFFCGFLFWLGGFYFLFGAGGLLVDELLIRSNYERYKKFKKSYNEEMTIIVEKLEAKMRKDEEKEKERKSEIFAKHSPQSGHRKPTMAMKNKAWNKTGGHCAKCHTKAKSRGLEFLWVIHPEVQLVLICERCAKKEGIDKLDVKTDNKRTRRIPTEVQDAVWNRDGGECVSCGSKENLEFDHIIPFSKGGSNTKRNIQLLCESCNRSKSDNIG